MAELTEGSIYNYSGLSSETKPTSGAGNTVPNGSRFREVDTNGIYFYDLSSDGWYSFDENAALISGHAPVVDLRSIDIFEQILTTLNKIEYHLSIATDTTL